LGGKPGEIHLWDVATGKEQATLKGHTDWVFSVAYSPDGKTLARGRT
jgi:WD40 repeat protein